MPERVGSTERLRKNVPGSVFFFDKKTILSSSGDGYSKYSTRHMEIYDPLIRRRYLIVIDDEVSVLSASLNDRLTPQTLKLSIANFSWIRTYGYSQVDMSLRIR